MLKKTVNRLRRPNRYRSQTMCRCAALFLLMFATAVSAQPPAGWFLAGSAPDDYTAELDRSNPHSGESSGLLAAKSRSPRGFGTLMQMIQPGSLRGQRVRYSASVRTSGVKRWAGLWLRIDGPGQAPLAFDNMQERPIRGDSGWQQYAIVLDVSKDATALGFGVLLSGPGRVWIDSAHIEVVDESVPLTIAPAPQLPGSPSNLGFEQ
jgi:hypothetical protein